MPDGNYAALVGLAITLAERHPCPMCDSHEWKSTDDPFAVPMLDRTYPAQVIPVACGVCGYTHLFLRTYLEDYVEANSKSDGH